MSVNDKKINHITNDNIMEEQLNPNYFTFSSENSPYDNKKTNNISSTPFYLEQNSKVNIKNKTNKIKIAEFSTNYQTFSPIRQSFSPNDENIPISDNSEKRKDIFENNNLKNEGQLSLVNTKKPKLSLKDSRTKIKQLRDKLYPLSEEERLQKQEEFLSVPLERMNDEKYKILKIKNLKRKSLPEYKSCQKYDEYYKPFENSLDEKNEFFLLKKKKSVYSNTKVMKLEINFRNKNKEKNFPLYKDQDIGVYEYWQVPLIENKIDEDNDSDDEQIDLARKVCELDLIEGIKYIQKNGIESLFNNKFIKKEEKDKNNIKNKSI